ncbi:MAG: hypothetical protein KF708_12885 [Pirellulales bacterium]|nr:hypothetical protein [Pirellulales bacterium]
MSRRPAASELLWCHETEAAIGLFSFAAETQTVALATSTGVVQLVERNGFVASQWQAGGTLVALAASDDGRAVASLDSAGMLYWHDRRGREHWRQFASDSARAVAIDSTAWYAAIADSDARVLLFDRHGRLAAQFPSPAPLSAIAFSRESPELVAVSESGFVWAMSLEGELLWRSRVTGSPRQLILSAGDIHVTSEAGVSTLDVAGRLMSGLTAQGAVPLVASSADGDTLLLADRGTVTLARRDGAPRWKYTAEAPILALALDPLLRHAWLAIAPNRLACFPLPRAS